MTSDRYDLIVIGSGPGGASLAHRLAPTGKRILMLERGDYLPRSLTNLDSKAVFVDAIYQAKDTWYGKQGQEFHPGLHYFVGGNSKVYGAALFRLRERDFGVLHHVAGVSPAWPLGYDTFEPYYCQAEELFHVHGQRGEDPNEPWSSKPYAYPPVSHEPRIQELNDLLAKQGLHPFHLPLGILMDEKDGKPTPTSPCFRYDAFDGFPCPFNAKADAQVMCVDPTLGAHENFTLLTNAYVSKLETDASGRSIRFVHVIRGGREERYSADIVVVACGALSSALLLLRSANEMHPNGLANRSGQVGRNYMRHNMSVLMALTREPNPTVFQKTLAVSDYYFGSDDWEYPLGLIQMCGRSHADQIRGEALPGWLEWLPEMPFEKMAEHSIDFWLQSEDLPRAENRIYYDGGRVVLDIHEGNLEAASRLKKKLEGLMNAAGAHAVLLGRRLYLGKDIPIGGTAHQAGTCRFGTDPKTSVLDLDCKAHDLDNLYITDASFFPSIGAVNPTLTIIANALRVADHIKLRLGCLGVIRRLDTIVGADRVCQPKKGRMMAQNVAEFVWKRLSEWGISRVYGYPGDGVGGLDVALERAKDYMHYVQVRHEEMAAFMASAHAKFTGEVGLCYATSGPGAIHLLAGLYDAKGDHMPVVAIVGQQARTSLGARYQQEVDLQNLFKDVAGDFVMQASVPSQVRQLIDRAVRIAHTRRAVTCVILPNDLQLLDYTDPPNAHGSTHTGIGYAGPAQIPDEATLRRAADVLNAGRKVAMLVGAGAINATDEVLAVADRLNAGVAKALLGKAVVPDDLPFVTGSLGFLGTKPSWDMMKECDTLLMVGSGFPFSEFLPKPGDARGVQIDIDGTMLGLRYPMEVNMVGDSAATLRALVPMLRQNDNASWRKKIEREVASWWKTLEERAMMSADPLNPQRVFWELSPRLPDNCILTADSGTTANWYARDIKIRRGMKGSLSGGLASLGAGTPYAMAAKMAFPERTVIAFMGDGAMQMNGMNVMITISKYWKEWSNPRLIVLVLNNRDLNQVTWEERIMIGAGKTELTQSIPDFPYHKYAELLGLKGIFVDHPDKVGTAWDEALAADCPVILEAYTDPNVPPLPPHITLEDAKHFITMMPSEPELTSVLMGSAKQMLAGILPQRS